jgi:hypothetical protein
MIPKYNKPRAMMTLPLPMDGMTVPTKSLQTILAQMIIIRICDIAKSEYGMAPLCHASNGGRIEIGWIAWIS